MSVVVRGKIILIQFIDEGKQMVHNVAGLLVLLQRMCVCVRVRVHVRVYV